MRALLNISKRKRRPSHLVHAPVPELQAAEFAAVYYDQRIGGDWCDFVRVSPTRVLFALLDIAGRVAQNRDVVSAAQAVFRSTGTTLFAQEDINEADAMIELYLRLNRSILNTAGAVCSSPAFAGCYDEELGTVSYFNAGHTPGLLLDEKRIIELPATGLPLGLFSHATPDASIVALEPGDALVLVSRGVVEASRRRKELSLEHVKDYLQRSHPKTAPEVCAAILHEVREFTGRTPRRNDLTVLALARQRAVKTLAATHS